MSGNPLGEVRAGGEDDSGEEPPSSQETFRLILLFLFPHVEASWEIGTISKADELGMIICTKNQGPWYRRSGAGDGGIFFL